MIDVIVCGSGPGAVHAAVPLVEAGLRVVMVDGAREDHVYKDLIPKEMFSEIRKHDKQQHRYFLGDDFEGIPLGPVRVGAQLTPPRQYIRRGVDEVLPVDAGGFQAFQTLALGGLAAGWGAATPPYDDADMEGWPIRRADLQEHYNAVAQRIGICGDGEDDLAPVFQDREWLLPRLVKDPNSSIIFDRYDAYRQRLNRRGLIVGHPRMAIATEPVGGRERFDYSDMEFYSDRNPGVYRPRYTVDELKKHPNFELLPGRVVRSYSEDEEGVITVSGVDIDNGNARWELKARRLLLGAGAINSARIVLQSHQAWDHSVPIVTNPYTYFPCLNFSRLLNFYPKAVMHSLTQVMLLYRSGSAPVVQGQIYSYRSLLTFKLMKESPLAMRESREIMKALSWYFVVLGVHHEDRPTRHKRLWIEKRNEDSLLRIAYRRTAREESIRRASEKGLKRLLPWLGCVALKRIDPGPGASIHYGGTLPMTDRKKRFTTTRAGRLRGTRNVYIVDGAALPHLPAKGLTFTIMANARRIGMGLAGV